MEGRSAMSADRYRIEYWHMDEVSVLDYSPDVTARRYLDQLREAHASGVVVVIAEGTGEAGIVGWYPLWPVDNANATSVLGRSG